MERDQTIIRVSIQGIIVNLIMVLLKTVIGFMTNSIAILLDAVNNLSDALSQVITIIGTKLSAKAPDKNHPYGYGRIEYISSIAISALIFIAGATSLRESILKTIHPEPAEYTAASLIIIAIAVVIKFVFGRYVIKIGEKVSSQSLIASGTEGFMDSIRSIATLVAAFVTIFFHISLEGILSVILSCFIIKAGLESLLETLKSIIGDRADSELTLEIKKKIRTYEGVNGAYDLILHDYGPSRSIGSVHIEVDDRMTAAQIHHLTRVIIADIFKEYGIVLTVGIYASNTTDPVMIEMKQRVQEIIKPIEHILSLHGFYVDHERKLILFDLVISFRAKSVQALRAAVEEKVLQLYPDYHCDINIDHDFTD